MDFSKLEEKQYLFGKNLSYEDLKAFKTIETFTNTSHDTRSLVQDEDGNFYLYDFHEVMNFSGNDDMYEHFFFLENEAQGRRLANADVLTLKTELTQYIWVGPGFNVVAVGK